MLLPVAYSPIPTFIERRMCILIKGWGAFSRSPVGILRAFPKSAYTGTTVAWTQGRRAPAVGLPKRRSSLAPEVAGRTLGRSPPQKLRRGVGGRTRGTPGVVGRARTRSRSVPAIAGTRRLSGSPPLSLRRGVGGRTRGTHAIRAPSEGKSRRGQATAAIARPDGLATLRDLESMEGHWADDDH